MANGPHSFNPNRDARPEVRHAEALEFIAQRLSGIEWQLATPARDLLKIATTVQTKMKR